MLSILIPTYNYNVFNMVSMLHHQCVENNLIYEIIVLDDGSGSMLNIENQKINSLVNCSFSSLEKNIGRTATRKKLAETALYSNLLFLDADVIPVFDNFIAQYIPYLGQKVVVFGGYAYRDDNPEAGKVLRLAYGREREEQPAKIRNKIPYSAVFSGNFLIDVQQFLENNYPGPENFYGMDNYFGYSLYKNKVKVLHINNPIYHLGLEKDSVFFEKSLESVRNRKLLLQQFPDMAHGNNLLKHYNRIKKYGLVMIVKIVFRIMEPFLKNKILNKKPSLFAFDLYRLGYICSLK